MRGEQHALVSGNQQVPESWVDFQQSARLGSAFAETLGETEEAAEKSGRLPDTEQAAGLRREQKGGETNHQSSKHTNATA